MPPDRINDAFYSIQTIMARSNLHKSLNPHPLKKCYHALDISTADENQRPKTEVTNRARNGSNGPPPPSFQCRFIHIHVYAKENIHDPLSRASRFYFPISELDRMTLR
jgi:hypothetical protein